MTLSCYRSCDLAHEVDGVGWGGVGHVNVRWNLYMMLLLRDDPSLELVHDVAATR